MEKPDSRPMRDACGKTQIMPQEPGFYLWYILDFSYLDVGIVQVLKDKESHLEWLRTKYKDKEPKTFQIYQNEAGETLTMYHQAHDHLPPMYNGFPSVDLFVTFDLENLPGRYIKLTGKRIPTISEEEFKKLGKNNG